MSEKTSKPLFDVVAVNLRSHLVRLIAESKTEPNADAIETMAVMRRGVEEEFFVTVPNGSYKEGESWRGK